MIDERYKIIEKAKKLKELAERGVDGEKVNAKLMYEKYCQKHNITEQEVNDFQYKKSSVYENMSDEDFMYEMRKEAVILGLKLMLANLFGKQNLKEQVKKDTSRFFEDYIVKMAERGNEKTKKK